MKNTILLLLLAIAITITITSCNKSVTPTLRSSMYIMTVTTIRPEYHDPYTHLHVSAGYPVDSVTIFVYGGLSTQGFWPKAKIVNGAFDSDLEISKDENTSHVRFTQYPSMKQITFPVVK